MTSFSNWLDQVVSVASYNLRTIPERRGAAFTSAIGIAGVVGVLVGVLAIAEGFRLAMTASGAKDIAVVMRTGSDSEMTSGLSRDETRLISDAPGVARDGDTPLTSAELFVIINLPKRSTGLDANVPLRGVEMTAVKVRDDVKIVQGNMFESGKNEIIVGAGAARAFAGLDLDKEIKIGQNVWKIVGIFTAGGGVAESEIWTDAAVLQPAYKREDSFQSVYARLSSAGSFTEFRDALTSNPQLKVKVLRLSDFYAEQSEMLTKFITTIGVFIASMMALGALFGALNTMYSAIASRTREIATLRAMGFSSGPVVISVIVESLAVSLIGGAIGAGIAYLAFNGYEASTLNWATFSQVTFKFAVTKGLLIQAIIWASVIGIIGGLFPAVRAARLPIASALRET
ncbi:ABC transporter permease [Verrucomicrobium sp. BvORR034]|uniref:ABC transporter permease n=1 Tax=Verrucomicrobium sp. BvORR034 TaxID=1396418 RepID=UPI0006787A81|nr:ABC transporter permease [Verrucomicrobium sp. BvORR034]